MHGFSSDFQRRKLADHLRIFPKFVKFHSSTVTMFSKYVSCGFVSLPWAFLKTYVTYLFNYYRAKGAAQHGTDDNWISGDGNWRWRNRETTAWPTDTVRLMSQIASFFKTLRADILLAIFRSHWNGVTLKSARFPGLERWNNASGEVRGIIYRFHGSLSSKEQCLSRSVQIQNVAFS